MGELINGRMPEKVRFNIAECAYGQCLSECPYDSSDECTRFLMEDALVLIQRLEAQQPKWISVKERLPEDPGYYLCWLAFAERPTPMHVSYLGDGKWTLPARLISHWSEPMKSPEEDAHE